MKPPAATAWKHRLLTLTAAAVTTLLAGACGGDGTPVGRTSTTGAPAQTGEYPIGTPSEWLTPELLTGSLRAIDQIFPTRTVARAPRPSELTRRDAPLDVTYRFDGGTFTLADFPERTRTTGLLVLHDGEILHESYHRGADESSRFLSMSVAKSFTSTLLGIARGEGLIASFDDPVTRYLPELAGTGYDGVSIRHILQMSSGIGFVEEYADETSDIARLGDACFGGPERLEEVAVTYDRGFEPGSDFHYASVDTAVLGWLLRRVTGKSLSAYMTEKLWQPIGAEADAAWVLDQEGEGGVECALGGLISTLRDYGRFGLLMAKEGIWNGRPVLPEGWVAEATIPDSPQVQPGELYDGYRLGYQYQWWTFPDEDHSFTGEGIHGQLLMVNPELDLVLVKTSDWETAWESDKERETWALWDSIQEWVRGQGGETS
jgi:hypothetical protein